MDREDLTVVNVRDLKVNYAKNRILDGINLKIKKGEFIAIVGPSGCGKTTLINAIAGFKEFNGSIERTKNIGVVFQDYAVFPWLKLEDNISFGLKGDKSQLTNYLEMIGLSNIKDNYPFMLSGGQKQRVALARTLAAKPELILMDEPYGALDIYTREKMQQWLLEIWQNDKKTIIFVTHSIDEAIFLADRVLLLKDKKIMKEYGVDFNRPRDKNIRFIKEFIDLKRQIGEDMNDS